jgi:hypothetical protein
MAKFEAFYRKMDKLNAAIKKAEKYLSKHPADHVCYQVPDEVKRRYLRMYGSEDEDQREYGIGNCSGTGEIGIFVRNDDGFHWDFRDEYPLREQDVETRLLFAPYIPQLIKLADATVSSREQEVEDMIDAIFYAIDSSSANLPAESQREWLNKCDSELEALVKEPQAKKPQAKKPKP